MVYVLELAFLNKNILSLRMSNTLRVLIHLLTVPPLTSVKLHQCNFPIAFNYNDKANVQGTTANP